MHILTLSVIKPKVQGPKTIYVNPANIAYFEAYGKQTKIFLNDHSMFDVNMEVDNFITVLNGI